MAISPQRPKSVTTFAGLVLILAVFYLLRFLQTLQSWDVLKAWLPFSPAYLAGSGLIWASVGIVLAAALWLGKAWARLAMSVAIVVFEGYYWLDRLFLVNPMTQEGWLFMAFVHGVVILWWIGINTRASTRKFFGVSYARERENQTIA